MSEVATTVGRLDNHLLALDRTRCKRQPEAIVSERYTVRWRVEEALLVTRAAPCALLTVGKFDRSIAIRQIIVHCPRALVRAHVRLSACTSAHAKGVCERVVRLVAR